MRDLQGPVLDDVLVGCALLGTGGGGSLDKGRKVVAADLAAGRSIRLAGLDDLPQETMVATPYYCGSLAPSGEVPFPSRASPYEDRECWLAVRTLEAHLNAPIGAVVATELGAGNTAAAFSVGAQLGLPTLDADGAGRSVPDLQHSTYFVAGIPIAPMGVANRFGDTAVVRSVADDFHAEALVRAMAVASGGHVGVADHPGRLGDVRKGLVADSISFARDVGRAIRLGPGDLVDRVRVATHGFLLFTGVVAQDCKYEDRAGFTFGEIAIRGGDGDRGHRYRIWFKNENIMGWRDGKVDATAPDLICVLDLDRKTPVLNPHAKRGSHVAVFGLPAPPIWRTAKGIRAFGPGYFGFRSKFVPVEKRHTR